MTSVSSPAKAFDTRRGTGGCGGTEGTLSILSGIKSLLSSPECVTWPQSTIITQEINRRMDMCHIGRPGLVGPLDAGIKSWWIGSLRIFCWRHCDCPGDRSFKAAMFCLTDTVFGIKSQIFWKFMDEKKIRMWGRIWDCVFFDRVCNWQHWQHKCN